jgi:hypothetical protein
MSIIASPGVYDCELLHLLTHKQNIGDKDGIALLKRVSLVAWQHINLHGRYEFTKSQDIIDMQEIIRELVKSSVKGKLGV